MPRRAVRGWGDRRDVKTCRSSRRLDKLDYVRVRALGIAAILILAGSAEVGGEAHAKTFRKGPYLQDVSRTSITIVWESSDSTSCQVRLLGDDARTLATEAARMHEVVLGDLESGSRYQYEVDCEGEKVRGDFATAPESDAPFSFVVFGDSRTNVGSHRRLVERVRREVPDFIIATGDMVDDGSHENEWQLFFDVERDLMHENVMFPCLGNHDRQGRGRTADNFRKYFSLPENSPDPERYYAFTYANARFLVLDSNAYSFALTDQTAWIEQQLQEARLDPQVRHIFVVMHHPPYSISLHGGREELRDAWTPLFERYQVAAVFSGHDHCYERAERNGIRYVVSGGGGAPLYPRSRNPSDVDVDTVRYFERTIHYVRVLVIGDFIEVSAIRGDGTLMEAFSWGAAPKAELDLAALAGMPEKPAERDVPREPPRARELAAAGVSGASRFGLLGILGAAMMIMAAGVLFVTLRR